MSPMSAVTSNSVFAFVTILHLQGVCACVRACVFACVLTILQ